VQFESLLSGKLVLFPVGVFRFRLGFAAGRISGKMENIRKKIFFSLIDFT
jgi:hypothetical protein